MRLSFNPAQHGWRFPNAVRTNVAGVFTTEGLCGGFALSAINYYRHGIPIPRLRWDDIPAFAKVDTPQGQMVEVNTNNAGRAHPVFDYILHSQLASFQSPNILKQFVLFSVDTDENHYRWSVNDEFPQIKRALNAGQFVILGLRAPEKGNLLGHQTLVYGYEDAKCTLYMYDPNHPDRETTVVAEGGRLRFSGPRQYRSYYLQIAIDPNRRSNFVTYDTFRNIPDNFAVRPPYADPVAQPGRPLQPGVYEIQSKVSGRLLDIDLGFANMGGRNNGALLQQWEGRNADNQKFRVEPVNGGGYKITALHSGKALDVFGISNDEGAPLQQWDYWGGANQHFDITPVNNGDYKIVAKHSGKALDVYGFSRDNGAKVKQYSFHGGDNQLWRLRKL